MAKARPISDLRADDAYGPAAAKIVRVRSQELADHSRGVLDMGDIERLHAMRVATRRLRAALEVFAPCFQRKAHRAALREVKELADALGERRDRDVAIEVLEEFAGQLGGADRDRVESLIGSLRMQQLQANEALRPHVSAERLIRLRASLEELVRQVKGTRGESALRARRVKHLDPAAPLRANAARIVRVRLEELRSFTPAALDPGASEVQHDMRIAAKRLRYVLELTEVCFGERGAAARRGARDLQGVLGDLHDCDVMLAMAEGQLKQLRELDAGSVRARAASAADLDPRLAAAAPHLNSYRGLEILAVHLEARGRARFDGFLELWEEQRRSGVWDELEAAAREQTPGGATLDGEGSQA